MKRPIPLAGCLFFSLAGLTRAQPAGPVAPDLRACAETIAKLGKAFVAGSPVEQALPPQKEGETPPCKPGALAPLIAEAKKVQQAKAPVDLADYTQRVRKAARDLKLTPDDESKAQALYLGRMKNPKPDAPNGGQTPEQLAAEKARLDKIYADPRTSEQDRSNALARSQAIAAGLGQMRTTDAPNGGPGTAAFPSAGGPSRALTPQQLAALNRTPGAQAPKSAAPHAPPPVPLTASQKQDAAMAQAEAEIKANPGQVRQARNYWIAESQDKSNNVLWRGYSYFNRGLLALSGLTEVEESAARTGWASGHPDVSARRVAWEGTKLAGNSALFAANFVGMNGGGQVVARARTIGKPVAMAGLEVTAETAGRVAQRSEQIASTVEKALGPGRDFKAATQAMSRYAEENLGGAFKVAQGGKWGEANYQAAKAAGEAGTIKWSPLFGKAHEFTHAQQMMVNRAAAMEIVASKAGKTASALSAGEVNQAMELASNFEKAYYAQHEAQALRTSGILGLFPGKNYGAKLAQNGAELTAAWAGKPQFSFSAGQKFFGALSGMGESQLAIAGTLASHANIPYVRQQYGQMVDITANAVGGLLPEPSLPSERKK